MLRIYLPVTHIKEGQIEITGEKARYLVSVLRCSKGDEVIVFDGKGSCLKTRIIRIDKKKVVTEVVERVPSDAESPANIILAQGLLKGQKMDLVVQKVTELGVKEIIPIITERSQIRETGRVVRWRKIAEEASRQSGRNIIPVVHEPIGLRSFLKGRGKLRGSEETLKEKKGEMKGLIFWEEGGLPLKDAILKISPSPTHPFTDSPIHLLVGPEGGFTREEVAFTVQNGFVVSSLGKRILRAETAAISAVTLIQFLLGDLN